jgi:hypothetical protein
MNRILTLGSVALLTASLAACAVVKVALVPGAAQVRLTKTPADVQTCKAVGNVIGRAYPWENDARNQAIGYGGDTVLETYPGQGVAYRCAKD